ncbi:hypothetical protein PF003_g34414 [Phytophthora fragariae]|nr:hypothetical protein PF003_g34414 [Phytophthora fragariae]
MSPGGLYVITGSEALLFTLRGYRARLPRVLLVLLASPTNLINAECSDVHVVFARGSGEMQGLGLCGEPLVSGIASNLGGMSVSSYAVNYAASMDQPSAGPGATDMTNHVVSVAKECPNTVFVLGGYSQGASVTATLGSGGTIPENLAPARRMDPSTA